MKVQYDNGPKRTWPFSEKNTGSLIIHENVLFLDIKMKEIMGFGHFLESGTLERLDIADLDRTICFFLIWQGCQVMKGHSRITKVHF